MHHSPSHRRQSPRRPDRRSAGTAALAAFSLVTACAACWWSPSFSAEPAGALTDLAPYATNEIILPNLYSLKQKVQWGADSGHRIIQTEHFEVVVADGEEELGARIAGIAEPFYSALEQRIGFSYAAPISEDDDDPPGRIPLIVYPSMPRFQETNTTPGFLPEGVRGFFEFMKGRIVFPHSGSNTLLTHVAQHEITHAFALNLSERAYARYREGRAQARSLHGDWNTLTFAAQRIVRAAPAGTFGPFERAKLHPSGEAVGLPNRQAALAAEEGRTLLAPRIYVGDSAAFDSLSAEALLRVTIQVQGATRIAALTSPAPFDSLRRAIALLPDTARVVVRRLEWNRHWENAPSAATLIDAAASDVAHDASPLLAALDEALAPPASGLGRAKPELVLGPIPMPDRRTPGPAVAALLPAYEALSEIAIEVRGTWPPPQERYAAAEDSLFRWYPPSLKPRLLPLALNEGAAEYFGSNWDALEEMVLRDALLTGRLPSIPRLGPEHGYLVYVGGESFLRYLGDTYGDESVILLAQALYLAPRLSEGARAIFGKDLEALSRDWHESLRRRVFPAYADFVGTGEWATRISSGRFDTHPRVSGERVVYKRARRARTEIIVREASGPERVVASDRRPGAESLHLLEGGLDLEGDLLAFAVQERGRDVLRVVNLATGEERGRFSWDSVTSISGVSISPDGSSAAITALDRLGNANLLIASLTTGETRTITDDIYEEASPCWGPSGILINSDRMSQGSQDLFLLDPADPAGRLRQITQTPWNETEAAWLPGGREAIALDDRHGHPNAFVVDTESHASRQVTFDRVGLAHLSCGEDRLVFAAFDSLRMRVWEAPLDSILGMGPRGVVAQQMNDRLGDSTTTAAAAGAPAQWAAAPAPPHTILPYRPRYGPDLLLVNANSYASQAYLGFSDLLGNRQIALILGSNAGESEDFVRFLNVGAIYSNLEGRHDWRAGLVRTGNEFLTEDEGFFFERETGALFGMTHALDRFRSLSWSMVGSLVERETEDGRDDTYGEVSAQTVLGHDTTVPDEYGYGYGGGLLTSLLASVDYRITDPTGWGSITGIYDMRFYQPLFGRTFLATRASYGLSTGRVPDRIRLGGSWTLRGYNFNDLQGDRFVLGNLEARFPLPLVARVGSFPLVRAVQGALFVDAGDAWFEGRSARWRGSLGFGFRTGLLGTVIRYDISKRFDERDGGLQDGTRGDLFVGYNF